MHHYSLSSPAYHIQLRYIFFLFFLLALVLCPGSHVLAYGPADEISCTTDGDIIVPDDVANPETAVEGNTNSVILIKAGTYNLTNFVVGSGNTVRPYNCDEVFLNFSTNMSVGTDNWTVAGLSMDWGNAGNGGFFIGDAVNYELRNNYIQGEHPLYFDSTTHDGYIHGNIIEWCPNCDDFEMKFDDPDPNGPYNITLERNWFKCAPASNTQEGHDLFAVEGIGSQGTLQSVRKPNAGNFGVAFRYNKFGDPNGGNCGENYFDLKIQNTLDADNQSPMVVENNFFWGPMPGEQTSETMGKAITVGDHSCGPNQTDCLDHLFTHNFFQDIFAPDEDDNEERAESIGGGSSERWGTLKYEYNITNSSLFKTIGVWGNVNLVFLRQNSWLGGTQRFTGNSCNANIPGGGHSLTLDNNVWVGSHVDTTCDDGGDWSVNNNLFFNTDGNEFNPRWDVGNEITNPQYANVSNNGNGGLNNDFTVLKTGNNSQGIPYNHLGALPSPQITGANIEDNCILTIGMQDADVVTNLGYSHMPPSSVDAARINVKYNGTGPQTIGSTDIDGNNIELTMEACPASDDVVTFDTTYGWCRDSANIGNGIEINITAGCLAVTGQAVTNNTTGSGGEPPGGGDTTPPVVEITEPAGT